MGPFRHENVFLEVEIREQPKGEGHVKRLKRKIISPRQSSNRRPSAWEVLMLTYCLCEQSGGLDQNFVGDWNIRIQSYQKTSHCNSWAHFLMKCAD